MVPDRMHISDNPLGYTGNGEAYYRYLDLYGGIQLFRYEVLRHTQKGAWVNDMGTKRFVLDGAHKRFAVPTIEEARTSFIARKRRQTVILQSQLAGARAALKCMEETR